METRLYKITDLILYVVLTLASSVRENRIKSTPCIAWRSLNTCPWFLE